jgi:uncharacterized protein (TIGR00297 family)
MMIVQLVSGIVLSLAISRIGYRRGALSPSGVAGALIVGILTFGLGGWLWGVLLAIFFVSSSLLSQFKKQQKEAAAEKFDKGHRRDFGQALANGGAGALVSLLSVLRPSRAWFPFFVGTMATVNADTWATELGTLSPRPPRLITNGQIVAVGTSGGVSVLGTAVSALGGLLIGLTAGLLQRDEKLRTFAWAGLAGGLTGSLFDSLLGATMQQIYYCDVCQKDTERRLHKCGTATRPLRGWRWLNNDLVNLLASLAGGLVALAVWLFFRLPQRES